MAHGPFFIVGSARSGTTLLRVILNAHPEVTVPPESRFITELWRGERDVHVDAFLDALAGHRQFRSWNMPVDDVRARFGDATDVPYVRAIEVVYEAYAARAGKHRWGDKTPRYVEHIPLLNELFPAARFVHLVRDGRDVALSYANVPFGPKTIAKAAALWARRVRTGVEDGRRLGSARYMELRYEDLVSEPDARVKTMCEFLEIGFVPEMMEYTEQAPEIVFEKAKSYNPKVLEKPTKSSHSWETDMPPPHVAVFEAVAGDMLDLFGYPRRSTAPGPAVRLSASLGRIGLPVGRLRRVEHAG